jgi:hypothetical protein
MSVRRSAFALVCWLALMLAAGCTSLVSPPATPIDPTGIYLADYGKHASLLFVHKGKLTEYAFGDFDWFALNKNKWPDAMRALFVSRGGGLGRRELAPPATTQNVADYVGARRVMGFAVSSSRVEALADALAKEYDQHAEVMVYNSLIQLYFVHVPERYWMFHNCNHVVARWLRALDVDVGGLTTTSDFRIRRDAMNRAQIWYRTHKEPAK